jgi:hypothetical protein
MKMSKNELLHFKLQPFADLARSLTKTILTSIFENILV